jgi:hypothetical protein
MGKSCELYTDNKRLKYIFIQSDLNLKQRRWLKLIKNYDLGINYHPRKATVVVHALSRRPHVNQMVVRTMLFKLCNEFYNLSLEIMANMEVIEMEVGSSLLQDIRRGKLEDEKIQEEKLPGFTEDDQGVLWYKGRICVPSVKKLKDKILQEAHESTYSIHPVGNKMYHDLKATYW